MNHEDELEATYAPGWADPRREEGFDPTLFPSCPGIELPAPGKALDLQTERRLRFLAVYYRLNVAYRELNALSPRSARRAQTLQRIEWLGIARDVLEDRCAPFGFFGEPKLDGIFVRALRFIEPPIPRELVAARARSSISLFMKVPLPDSGDEETGKNGHCTAGGIGD